MNQRKMRSDDLDEIHPSRDTDLFVFCFISSAVSSSYYAVSNDRMINELKKILRNST
jgi:hypothetical protein